MKHRFLFITFFSILMVGLLHFIASAFYYYWTVGWFDNLMHLLGGFSIGLLSLWIYFSVFKTSKIALGRKEIILRSFIFVIVVGVGWEIFEYLNGITQSTERYQLDVVHDLIADTIGAILAGDLVSRKKLYANE